MCYLHLLAYSYERDIILHYIYVSTALPTWIRSYRSMVLSHIASSVCEPKVISVDWLSSTRIPLPLAVYVMMDILVIGRV